jgi:hypothetical protein
MFICDIGKVSELPTSHCVVRNVVSNAALDLAGNSQLARHAPWASSMPPRVMRGRAALLQSKACLRLKKAGRIVSVTKQQTNTLIVRPGLHSAVRRDL